MVNGIVICNAADITAAETIAATLPDYKVYLFDPALLDKVLESKLSNVELITWQSSLNYPELVKWAHSAALKIEKELEQVVDTLLSNNVSILSWQHLNLYYILMAARWYERLWPEALLHIVDTIFIVFVNDNPAQYYFPSFIPSIHLLQFLGSSGIEFKAYTYGRKEDDSGIVPDFKRLNEEQAAFDILVHVPTCFYDYKYFNDELMASKKRVVKFESMYWDTSLDASYKVGLAKIEDQIEALSAYDQKKVAEISDCIAHQLDALLEPYISPPAYRSRQCQNISSRYRSQLVIYDLLKKKFKHQRPEKILISDHDSGFHGPIFSFAESINVPVLLVPHSKTCTDIEFDGYNTISLTHPIQGECISDRNGKKLLGFSLSFPEEFVGSSKFPDRVKKIGLLLNGFSLNGVLSTQYAAYMVGIKTIHNWCVENKIELGIRCRPGMTLFRAITDEIAIDRVTLENSLQVSMAQFAKDYDLCLMYGCPTTGALEYLRNSIPILNPVPSDISWTEASFANSKVIPRGSVQSILNILDSFVSDRTNFFVFRNDQFKEYINLFSTAHPLRSFL